MLYSFKNVHHLYYTILLDQIITLIGSGLSKFLNGTGTSILGDKQCIWVSFSTVQRPVYRCSLPLLLGKMIYISGSWIYLKLAPTTVILMPPEGIPFGTFRPPLLPELA